MAILKSPANGQNNGGKVFLVVTHSSRKAFSGGKLHFYDFHLQSKVPKRNNLVAAPEADMGSASVKEELKDAKGKLLLAQLTYHVTGDGVANLMAVGVKKNGYVFPVFPELYPEYVSADHLQSKSSFKVGKITYSYSVDGLRGLELLADIEPRTVLPIHAWVAKTRDTLQKWVLSHDLQARKEHNSLALNIIN